MVWTNDEARCRQAKSQIYQHRPEDRGWVEQAGHICGQAGGSQRAAPSGVVRVVYSVSSRQTALADNSSVCDSRRSQKLHVVSGCGWAKTSDRRGWFRGHAQTLVSMPLTATRHKAMARANKAGVCGMNVGGGWSVEECGADAGLF